MACDGPASYHTITGNHIDVWMMLLAWDSELASKAAGYKILYYIIYTPGPCIDQGYEPMIDALPPDENRTWSSTIP